MVEQLSAAGADLSGEALTVEEVLGRIADLAEELSSWPDQEVSARVAELLDWVDAFHREGLGRLIDLIREWGGSNFLAEVAKDGPAGLLLSAYSLGEDPEVISRAEAAIAKALEDIRPLAESHGGAIELQGFADGVVTVRLHGTCHGCPSASATLTYGVQAALREHWPDFRRLELAGDEPEPDPDKADLTCGVPSPKASPAPRSVPVQFKVARSAAKAASGGSRPSRHGPEEPPGAGIPSREVSADPPAGSISPGQGR